MKVTIKDFITWMYIVHGYMGGGGSAGDAKGQAWDDGITFSMFQNWGPEAFFKDDDLPISTPLLFFNFKKNKNKNIFREAQIFADEEYLKLQTMSKKEFNKTIEENT